MNTVRCARDGFAKNTKIIRAVDQQTKTISMTNAVAIPAGLKKRFGAHAAACLKRIRHGRVPLAGSRELFCKPRARLRGAQNLRITVQEMIRQSVPVLYRSVLVNWRNGRIDPLH
jgi:hypothetical protein